MLYCTAGPGGLFPALLMESNYLLAVPWVREISCSEGGEASAEFSDGAGHLSISSS